MILTTYQFKMARAALNMSRFELAKNIGVHERTIDKIENSDNFGINVNSLTLKKIITYFTKRGLKFIGAVDDEGIDGAGVRYFPISKDKKKK